MIMFLCKSNWHLKYVSAGAAHVYSMPRKERFENWPAQSYIIGVISVVTVVKNMPCINPGQRLGEA
jgi:hypothetical protein